MDCGEGKVYKTDLKFVGCMKKVFLSRIYNPVLFHEKGLISI